MAAVCGDSMSTAVTMGAVSLPEMEKKKYKSSLATGSLAAGGTLGILILPSVGFIFYAIVTEESVGAFVYALCRKRITTQKLMLAMREKAKLTTKLMMILIGVAILGYFLAATRLPFILADVITGMDVGRYVIFTAILFLFIILGCLMNVIPMILLTPPAIYPSIIAMGFDPIWFGVITVIVMDMGQTTPPIGVNVFALSSVPRGCPWRRFSRRGGVFNMHDHLRGDPGALSPDSPFPARFVLLGWKRF